MPIWHQSTQLYACGPWLCCQLLWSCFQTSHPHSALNVSDALLTCPFWMEYITFLSVSNPISLLIYWHPNFRSASTYQHQLSATEPSTPLKYWEDIGYLLPQTKICLCIQIGELNFVPCWHLTAAEILSTFPWVVLIFLPIQHLNILHTTTSDLPTDAIRNPFSLVCKRHS